MAQTEKGPWTPLAEGQREERYIPGQMIYRGPRPRNSITFWKVPPKATSVPPRVPSWYWPFTALEI